MTRPYVSIVDVQTQEEIIRKMNDAEYEQHLIDTAASKEQAAVQAQKDAEEETKKSAKIEALAALGLSADIINLLAN